MQNHNKIYLTKEGKEKLEKELYNLINITRPSVIEELKEARSHGDLSENSEYDAAKNKQGEVEARIREIEAILEKTSLIVNEDQDKSTIHMGSTVEVKYPDGNLEVFKIVSAIESNPSSNPMKISNETPVAKAILGKKIGDKVNIIISNDKITLKIISVK